MIDNPTQVRQINLLLALRDGDCRSSSWLRSQVADYSQISKASVRNVLIQDIRALRAIGVPIKVIASPGMENSYQLLADSYELPEVCFTPAEAEVLGFAGDISREGKLGPFVRSGWIKLAAAGAQRKISDLTSGVYLSEADSNKVDGKTLTTIISAICLHKGLKFSYRPSHQ